MQALITGCGRGLGLALAERYAKAGHTVHATARNPKESPALAALEKRYEGVHIYAMDVADWPSIEACAKAVARKTDVLDIIINNAGVLFPADQSTPLYDVDVRVLQTTMAINVEGPILVLKGFWGLLQKSARPALYVITSESTIADSWAGMPVYSLSKVAANKAAGIIRATLPESAQVLAIHPGRMRTDMNKTSAEIDAMDAANGIFAMSTGDLAPDGWYVNYLGEAMPL